MIGYLSGKIIENRGDRIILDVSGVGYEVNVPANLVFPKADISLFVHTHVREDSLSLYGFPDGEALNLFKALLSVSGIGPRVALSILGTSSAKEIQSSIAAGDSSILSSVSGVGKKTAEKAIIELRGKMDSAFEGVGGLPDGKAEIFDALLALGFQRNEVLLGLKNIPEEISSTEDKIKFLIKNIGKK